LRDRDVVLLDALVACGEALEDPEKSWSETRGLVHEAVLAHPAAEGLRSRLQLNEELIALSPTEMLFVPLVEDLPRKEGGGWSPEVHAVLAAEAKRLVGMARHAPDEAAGAVLLEPEYRGGVFFGQRRFYEGGSAGAAVWWDSRRILFDLRRQPNAVGWRLLFRARAAYPSGTRPHKTGLRPA